MSVITQSQLTSTRQRLDSLRGACVELDSDRRAIHARVEEMQDILYLQERIYKMEIERLREQVVKYKTILGKCMNDDGAPNHPLTPSDRSISSGASSKDRYPTSRGLGMGSSGVLVGSDPSIVLPPSFTRTSAAPNKGVSNRAVRSTLDRLTSTKTETKAKSWGFIRGILGVKTER